MSVLRLFSTRQTPQNRPADHRQSPNAAGGYGFTLDDEARLRRFLTLGTDGGTFYTRPLPLTEDNAQVVLRMAASDHATLVRTIVEVSTRGAAPRPQPALFALAIAASHGTDAEKAAALAVLGQVARTGTHLFWFATYVEQFRGWGRGLRRAVARWYTETPTDALTYQTVKYRQRDGWSHRDLLRLAHPVTQEPARRALFDWVVRGATGDDTPRLVTAFVRAQEPGADVARLVREERLTWEMLPSQALTDPAVWDALLDTGVPQTALLRQLPRLTRLGLLPDTGGRTDEVCAQLTDPGRLRAARVHPVAVLLAQRTYASGRSLRGEGTWTPSRKVVDALDQAFYEAFGAVEPTGRRTLMALDVSGSMVQPVSGLPLSCREASAALALVTLAVERQAQVVGFTSKTWRGTGLSALTISPRQRLDDAVRAVSQLPFGGTDCALPMLHARQAGLEVDTFVVYTDNETWAGSVHPHQALRAYREATGIPAKLVVVAMTATQVTIADPSDAGMLDVAGFDAAVPQVVSDFARA
ncbi:MAG: TROVE domain-containing protein [Actinomycetia bacterium]|nr:TROVE domain-containing protein [Actinomycetes bacterium]